MSWQAQDAKLRAILQARGAVFYQPIAKAELRRAELSYVVNYGGVAMRPQPSGVEVSDREWTVDVLRQLRDADRVTFINAVEATASALAAEGWTVIVEGEDWSRELGRFYVRITVLPDG